MNQIGANYRDEIKNWSEVGGTNKPYFLYGRKSNSGAFVFYQENVLGNQDYSSDTKPLIDIPRMAGLAQNMIKDSIS